MSVPVVLVVGLLAVVAFALQVSSLGALFLVWALTGGFRWLAEAKRVPPRTTLRG